MNAGTLVSPDGDFWDAPGLVLLDARSGPDVEARFVSSRLAGARRVDLETDLSEVPVDASHGGRHPLPEIAAWGLTLGRLGITPRSRVIVYDDKGGANAAARAWWMLRSVGHDDVAVLDGGFQAALALGRATESGAQDASDTDAGRAEAPISYPVTAFRWPITTREQITHLDDDQLLVDVRAPERYRGEVEPIDPVAGHLPGAVNHPLSRHLGEDGRFLPHAALRLQLAALLEGRDAGGVIYSCGSGVTACHGVLAMVHAGFAVPSLYVGSWSEWCRRSEVSQPHHGG